MKPNLVLLVALLVVSAGVLAAGCTLPGGNATQPTAQPTGTGTPSATETTSVTAAATTVAGGQNATVGLTAANLAFNASTITVPAGAEVTVNFDNQDDGIQHNFAVYTDSSAAEEIFAGEIITGPAETTYTFTAPEEPGTYFFRCDVHPQQMTGDFVVQ